MYWKDNNYNISGVGSNTYNPTLSMTIKYNIFTTGIDYAGILWCNSSELWICGGSISSGSATIVFAKSSASQCSSVTSLAYVHKTTGNYTVVSDFNRKKNINSCCS